MNKFFQDKFSPIYQKSNKLYQRHKKYFPVIFFVGGFLWDNLTLTRIDRMLDELILLAYILLLAVLIIIVNLADHRIITKDWLLKFEEWYPLGIQFFLGGLFSSYVVFYFRSASLSKNWLFIGLLVILLISNEFLEKRLKNIYLQISLLFLVSFSFFIFFFPIVTRRMNGFMFILSGFVGLVFVGFILFLLYRKFGTITTYDFRKISSLVLAIYLLINVFYYLNWIPPVPLSLKIGGIYHHVSKTEERYRLIFEQPEWYQVWKKSDNPYKHAEGDTVFCFTSVFAPTRLSKKIFHHWQHFNPKLNDWETTDHLGFQITGGRDGGYRGFTYKTNTVPGRWRVDVLTREGQLLGRIHFTIQSVAEEVQQTKTIFR